MERIGSHLNQNGTMVIIKDLNRKRTKNKASPSTTTKKGNAIGL